MPVPASSYFPLSGPLWAPEMGKKEIGSKKKWAAVCFSVIGKTGTYLALDNASKGKRFGCNRFILQDTVLGFYKNSFMHRYFTSIIIYF